uniref:Uncharacterized protein n=1 Tax=Vitis vinifera TaxID=29760 RepID=F6HES1_VITVI
MTNDSKQKTPKVAKSSANKWKKAVVDENVEICKKATFDRATIDPPFCPSSTCPIMCLGMEEIGKFYPEDLLEKLENESNTVNWKLEMSMMKSSIVKLACLEESDLSSTIVDQVHVWLVFKEAKSFSI